jgi:outer membrane protein assembly factor BamB
MFRGGIDRLGVYKTKSPDYAIRIWNFTTGNQVQSSPILYENKIYFGSDDSNVYCLDADTGEKIWNFTAKNLIQSTPTIVDERLYIGSNDYSVYCLNPQNGALIWQHKTQGPILSSPLVVNNTVYVGSYDNNVYAINALNGSRLWNFTTGHEIWASPAYADDCIYIGSLDGNMYSLWANNGTKRWNFSSITDTWEKAIYSTCAIFQGQMFYGAEDQNVYCLNIQTGDLIWYYGSEGYLYSSPAIHNEVVFIAGLGNSPNGELYAIPGTDPNGDGVISEDEVVWRSFIYDIDGGSSPIVVDGKVIVGSNYKDVGGGGRLICFDEVSGLELWNYTTEGDIHSSPVATINKIFIGSLDNNMYCIGSTEKPLMEITSSHLLENNVVEAGRTIDLTFSTTAFGELVEQPWYTFETSGGELSATFGTGFLDGTFKISFTAPLVTQNTTVTIKAKAVKVGYENGSHEITFFIEPLEKSDSDEDEFTEFIEDMFSERNQFYFYILLLLIIINIIVFILILKKRKKMGKNE